MITNISSVIDISLDNTKEDEEEEEIILDEELSVEEFSKIFFDGNESFEKRVDSLEKLDILDKDMCAESVNKITSMFMFSPTDMFRKLLKYIILNGKINNDIKNECARAIYDDDKNSGYECFLKISQDMSSFPTPLQLDIIRILMETDKYYNETLSLLVNLLTNQSLENEYRYKTLLSIQRDNSRTYVYKYLDDAYFEFIKDNKTYTRYRIVGSQYILQHKTISQDVKDEIEKICISFAADNQLDYNLRADSADLLVRLGSESSKELGRDIITLLGRNTGGITTVYTDRQNVHDDNIDESVRKFILDISSVHLKNNSEGKYTTFSDVQQEIEKIVLEEEENKGEKEEENKGEKEEENKGEKEEENKGRKEKSNIDKVRSSLLRIYIDQTIYDGGQTLQSIFNKVWQIINDHEYSESLRYRMIEELIDMADTCASGHVSRIINVLSGFEINGKTISLDIGWKKQIQSNLLARLNTKIKDIEDEKQQETLLDEMMTSGDIINKPTLNTFFRENLIIIRDEMYREFIEYITEDIFEEHFRSAITIFESG
jgi:hypothetical protein